MKNLKYTLFTAALSVAMTASFSSCSDSFLDEKNKSSYTTDYFKTSQGIQDLATALYGNIRWHFGYEWAYGITLYGTDEFTNGSDLTAEPWNTYDSRLNPLDCTTANGAMLAQLKPAAINQQLVVLLYMKHTPGFNPQEQLDTYFQQQAGQQGKKVGGLETAQSQIDILFNSQTLQRQANLLYCAISDIEKGIEQSKRLIAAYEKQDLDAMLQLMEERDGNSCDPLPGEMEAMLDNRNKAWVEKMPAIMTEAPTLFVVGAGHLPGDNGVLNLLKQQGYTIEAMK